jgi:hypothetical protein
LSNFSSFCSVATSSESAGLFSFLHDTIKNNPISEAKKMLRMKISVFFIIVCLMVGFSKLPTTSKHAVIEFVVNVIGFIFIRPNLTNYLFNPTIGFTATIITKGYMAENV